jgi:hypothetical protein
MSERQFEAVAPQPALIYDRKMATNRAGKSGSQIWRETRLASNGLIQHGEFALREYMNCIRSMREHDALIKAHMVKFCNSL